MTIHGIVDSYDGTVPQKREVTDKILLTSPLDRTIIDKLGLDNVSKFRFVNHPFRTYEWLEDAYVGRTDSLTASGGLASGTTTTTCLVTTPKMYNVGDILQIDDELVWTSAIDISGAQLTIVREFGGTDGATHANSSVIYIRGNARLEGADADDSPSTEVTSTTNCSQIFQRTVQVSRDEQLFPLYGIDNLKEYKIQKRMDELIMLLNCVPYFGKRSVGSSAHSSGRSAGGITTFVDTNKTELSSVALTRDHIDDLLEACYGYGGTPDLLFCNTFQQRRINSMYEDFIRTVRDEKTGGHIITTLLPPLGNMRALEVIVDRLCPTDYVYMLDSRYVGYITIDPFFYEELAKDGDSEKGEVVGEYGFVLAHEKAHAWISGLTTS